MKTVLVALAVLILGGCSAQGPQVDIHTQAPAPAPKPAEQALVSGLEKIDPGLTTNPERALRRSEDVCKYQGSEDKVLDYTRQKFDGGNASVDQAKAKLILEAVRASGLCG